VEDASTGGYGFLSLQGRKFEDSMVELIQLVDESLARHGFASLLQTERDVRLESSLGSRLLAETAETTKDPSAPNWAKAPGVGKTSLSPSRS
jgi:hypothetical protein